MVGAVVISIFYIALVVAMLGLGIYTLVLIIKALKIYIRNNS